MHGSYSDVQNDRKPLQKYKISGSKLAATKPQHCGSVAATASGFIAALADAK